MHRVLTKTGSKSTQEVSRNPPVACVSSRYRLLSCFRPYFYFNLLAISRYFLVWNKQPSILFLFVRKLVYTCILYQVYQDSKFCTNDFYSFFQHCSCDLFLMKFGVKEYNIMRKFLFPSPECLSFFLQKMDGALETAVYIITDIWLEISPRTGPSIQ